jgi:hypothetical protein
MTKEAVLVVVAVAAGACAGQRTPEPRPTPQADFDRTPSNVGEAGAGHPDAEAEGLGPHLGARHPGGPLFVVGRPIVAFDDAGYCSQYAGPSDSCSGEYTAQCGPHLPFCVRPLFGRGARDAEWGCCGAEYPSFDVPCAWPREVAGKDAGCPCLGCD